MLLLILNVLPNCGFIQTHRTDTVATSPETPSQKSTFCFEQGSVHMNRTLAFEIAYRHGSTELGRNAQ
jgi:hypothetical protein